jgi:hypothetical protein
MAAVKPLRSKPLTFSFCGGDIFWRADGRLTPICEETAIGLRALYSDESRAAYRAGDKDGSAFAAGLWTELTRALDALDAWRRAHRIATPVPGFTTIGQALGNILAGLSPEGRS